MARARAGKRQSKKAVSWKWPDSLDALAAAPQYHRLVLENERVRVLETRIPPGETAPLHTHRWGGVHFFLSFSDFVRRDERGRVLLDTRRTPLGLDFGGGFWVDPLAPHSVENVGSVELRAVNFEMKKP